jgi:hypothetical protein
MNLRVRSVTAAEALASAMDARGSCRPGLLAAVEEAAVAREGEEAVEGGGCLRGRGVYVVEP